jgi:3-hydroxyacyl-CoA dehydrogenase/enoyl-CoA hydratase/3-hydroxybutyryl-CoA epimerase
MVNEAAFCLEEKIVSGVMEIDGGMIFGTGFPPFRGGLLRYADRIGIREVVVKLEELQEKHGERFKPAKLLKKMEKSGKGFYQAL